MIVTTTDDWSGTTTDHDVALRWTKVAGSWVVRVPRDANVQPGDTLTVFKRSGDSSDVIVERLGPTFYAHGVAWQNAHPIARQRSARRYQSTGTYRTWKQTYGRCEDAPCCGCCS